MSHFNRNKKPPEVTPMVFWGGTPCMPWPGQLNAEGYGRVYPKNNKGTPAHRAIYENHRGKVPDHLVIDHLCRNRRCVNPDHLEAVTDEENIRRGNGGAAKNMKKTACHKGHPFTGDNILWTHRDGHVHRHCRECSRIRNRGYMRAKAAARREASK